MEFLPVRNHGTDDAITIGGIEIPPGEWRRVSEVEARRAADPNLEIVWSYTPRADALVISSPLSTLDGYGNVGVHLMVALDNMGVPIIPVAHAWGNPLNVPARLRKLQERGGYAQWGICHGLPSNFENTPADNIIWWFMWESDLLPQPWVPFINERAAAVLVPSTSQVEIFRKSGITRPIYVMYDCVDPRLWTYAERPVRDTFTFATWARMSGRKCPLELLDCFWKAFPSEQDVRLVIKTSAMNFGTVVEVLPRFADPRIQVINAGDPGPHWTAQQVVELAHQADAAVFLSHGEGFYLGPVEAMMTGLPTIVPSHSGPADYADEQYNYPVPTVGMAPSPLYPGAQWWVMDYDAVVRRMREIYEQRAEAKARGQRAAAWTRERFTPRKSAETLMAVLPQIQAEYRPRPWYAPSPERPGQVVSDVSVFLLTHNGGARLERCLNSLLTCRDLGFELILIDNGSDAETADFCDAVEYRRLKVIHTGQNLSFAAANNRAAQEATGDYFLLLNDDCYVEEGCLSAMRAAFDYDRLIGAVGARLLFADKQTLAHAGGWLGPQGQTGHFYQGHPADWPPALASQYVHWCTGACLMIKRELYGLDEVFDPGYWEDTDLCLRIRHGGGRVWYAANAVAVHEMGACFGSDPALDERRRNTFARLGDIFRARWGDHFARLTNLP